MCVLLWLQPKRSNGTQELFYILFCNCGQGVPLVQATNSGDAGFWGSHSPRGPRGGHLRRTFPRLTWAGHFWWYSSLSCKASCLLITAPPWQWPGLRKWRGWQQEEFKLIRRNWQIQRHRNPTLGRALSGRLTASEGAVIFQGTLALYSVLQVSNCSSPSREHSPSFLSCGQLPFLLRPQLGCLLEAYPAQ